MSDDTEQGGLFDFNHRGTSAPRQPARPTFDQALAEYRRALQHKCTVVKLTNKTERIVCPMCDDNLGIYARPFDGQMLDYLERLYRHSTAQGFGYHHARDFLGGTHKASSNGTELVRWHFIEGANGSYRITRAGAKFVRGEMQAPAGVVLVRRERIGWFSEMVFAENVRGRPWDFNDDDKNLDLEGIPNWTALQGGRWQ